MVPEISKGEIQVSPATGEDRSCGWRAGGRGATLVPGVSPGDSRLTAVGVTHFSPSRTSRPVERRPEGPGGVKSRSRVAPDPGIPSREPDGRKREVDAPQGVRPSASTRGDRVPDPVRSRSHRGAVRVHGGVLGRRRILLQSATLRLGWSTRPVLKHGPRSLTCARVVGSDTLR